MLRRRLWLEWWVIALLTALLVTGLVLTRTTSRIDNAVYDLLAGLRAPAPSDDILIVAIDDESVARIGRWPWPRSVHARGIDRIGAARPRVIAYDVLFTEPSVPQEDAALAGALRRAPVLLPVLFNVPGSNGRPLDAIPPIPPFAGAARGIGHVALPHEQDGTARAALLEMAGWPHLMELAYRATRGGASRGFSDQPVLIPYQRPGTFRAISFADVLDGSAPAQFLRGKTILVGMTAGGLGDRHAVPSGGAMPGIEVQANLLNALIWGRLVHEAPLWLRLALAVLPSLVLLTAFWWLRPSRAFAAAMSAILAMAAAPVLLLAFAGIWLPPVAGLIGLLLVYPLWGWRRLQAVDGAIARELALFGGEAAPRARDRLDSVGGQAAQLSTSIAQLRDLRRLIEDTVGGVGDPLVVTAIDGRVLLANAPAQALLDVLDPQQDEDEITLADGRVFSLRRTPLTGGDGAQRGWILLFAEITTIRQAERDREEALEFLSHDMRSPQASIVALVEGDRSPVAQRIAGYARRTLGLADDFVQLARLRDTAFDAEETDLCDSLAEAKDAVWPLARRAGVRVEGCDGEEPRCVLGERHALTRAFLNLFDNAVKFSPAGGTVTCAIRADGEWFEVSIADKGPGVPPEQAEALFSRFGQTTRKGYSSGLGLAYIRTVAERHGGSVRYETNAPQGARFVLRFPSAERSAD